MERTTRRGFLGFSATATAGLLCGATAALLPQRSAAEPFGLPLGLQLYSVRDQMKQDFAGTLAALGKLGYREVEAAGFYGRSAPEFRAALQSAGLQCVSSHSPFAQLRVNFPDILSYARQLGVGYLICASPGHRAADTQGKLTVEDWRWIAGEFNRMGEICSKAGIQFGYHNHIPEFGALDGVVPYEELMRLTDPAKVTFELDCGWAKVAGADPASLMKQHPGRISMLHVKDFKSVAPGEGEHTPAELGQGSMDYAPIFAEAKQSQRIRHVFIEQEAFDMPWQQSLKLDAEYLEKLS